MDVQEEVPTVGWLVGCWLVGWWLMVCWQVDRRAALVDVQQEVPGRAGGGNWWLVVGWRLVGGWLLVGWWARSPHHG